MVCRPQIQPRDPQALVDNREARHPAAHQDNKTDHEPMLRSVVTRVSPPTPAQDLDNHLTAETAGRLSRKAANTIKCIRKCQEGHNSGAATEDPTQDSGREDRGDRECCKSAGDPSPGRDTRHYHPQE